MFWNFIPVLESPAAFHEIDDAPIGRSQIFPDSFLLFRRVLRFLPRRIGLAGELPAVGVSGRDVRAVRGEGRGGAEKLREARLRTAGNFNPVFEEKTKGWTLPDEGLKVLHGQNILFDGGPNPKGVLVESKEMFKPGDLAIPPEELKARYDPEDWAAFEAKAKATDIGDGRTVWEWMNGVPAPAGARAARPRTTPPPTYAFDPADPVCTALQCEKGPPLSIEEAEEGTNPHYAQGREYQINCQRCVTAYELRRRGYLVTALPWKRNGGDFNRHVRGLLESPGRDALQGWPRSLLSCMREIRTAPVGARFSLRLGWRNTKDGHFIVAERTGSGIRLIDPQNPRADVRGYFRRTRADVYGILRLDNRAINLQNIGEIATRSK